MTLNSDQHSSAQPVGPVMAALSAYMARRRIAALPRRRGREGQASHPRHVRRDDLRCGACRRVKPRSASRAAMAAKRTATVAGSNVLCGPIEAALANGVLAHADETDDSQPVAVASRRRGRAGSARGRRAVRHRRHAFPARRGARIRHRPARDHVRWAFAGDSARGAQEQRTHRRRVRRRGGRRVRGRARPPADALAARLHRAAVLGHRRVATRHATTSRRLSCSAACRRAAA